jgi:hypothetical protein
MLTLLRRDPVRWGTGYNRGNRKGRYGHSRFHFRRRLSIPTNSVMRREVCAVSPLNRRRVEHGSHAARKQSYWHMFYMRGAKSPVDCDKLCLAGR